ncbi:hypothetical protein BU23DRAFT_333505 [Bimuria novae-zelandiae CBS 107.79]|uniref:Uncharacterized protein n=1 Tax=Bimuria novae-zelandiae CBS 107.79 TaxID=1447943 RepID=A0A6A5UT82_9PLEO|nr:hypothetical protein BU23DRAFT_333505 [Bimuria novae-zelandiae CBS 107.79]
MISAHVRRRNHVSNAPAKSSIQCHRSIPINAVIRCFTLESILITRIMPSTLTPHTLCSSLPGTHPTTCVRTTNLPFPSSAKAHIRPATHKNCTPNTPIPTPVY